MPAGARAAPGGGLRNVDVPGGVTEYPRPAPPLPRRRLLVHQFPKDIGWIEVICGSMFSGKTEELIRRVKRAVYGKQQVQVFKPKLDNRYDETPGGQPLAAEADLHADRAG